MQITVSSIREAARDKKIDLIIKYVNHVEAESKLPLEQELATMNLVISCKEEGLALDKWSDLTYISPDKGYNAYEYLRDYYGIDTNVPLSAAELYEKYPKLFHERCAPDEEELRSWYNALTIRIMVKISEEIKKSSDQVKVVANQVGQVEAIGQHQAAERSEKIWATEKAEAAKVAEKEDMLEVRKAAMKTAREKLKKEKKKNIKAADGKRHPAKSRNLASNTDRNSNPDKTLDVDPGSQSSSPLTASTPIKTSSAIFNRWVHPDKLDEFCARRRKRMEQLECGKHWRSS